MLNFVFLFLFCGFFLAILYNIKKLKMTCCDNSHYKHCDECEKRLGSSTTPEMKKIEERLARKYTCPKERKQPRIPKRKGLVTLGPCECRCRAYGKPVIMSKCNSCY